jgi:hypothetical protein
LLSRGYVCFGTGISNGKESVKIQKLFALGQRFFFVFLLFGIFCQLSTTRAQGPAPESAPPLFPGGALISYSSTFLTRAPMNGLRGGILA